MANVRTIALGAVVAGTFLYGVIKGYVYFSVRGGVDDAITMAQPFADITYDGISTDLSGAVALHQVEVKAPGGGLPLRIGTLQLLGPGPGFLLDLAGGFEPGRPPEWMELSLQGVELPHPQDFSPDLEWSPVVGSLAGDEPEPCSLGDVLQRGGVLQAEEFPLHLDAGVGYRIGAEDAAMSTHLFYRIDGGDFLELEVAMATLPDPRMAMLGSVPAAQRFSLGYVPDSERVSTVVRECAAAGGMTEKVFVYGLAQDAGGYFAKTFGFAPGPGLQRALQQFLLDPGEVRITARPDELVFQGPVAGLTPEQLVPLLNLTLTVGDQPVDDLSFSREQPDRPGRGGQLPSAVDYASTAASGADDETGPVPRAEPLRFLQTPVADLGTYRYHQVRLHTSRREVPVEGTLVSLSDGQASVEQRIHGGTMTVHVPLTAITRAAVLRRKAAP